LQGVKKLPIAFSLGREERIVVLDRLNTEKLDEFFVARLKSTERDAARVNFELSHEAFEVFAKALGQAVEQGSKESRDEILFVMHSIHESIHETGEEDPLPAPPPGSPADQVTKEAARLIEERGATTIDDVNEILQEVQDAYNHRPQGALGGLAPYEAQRLFNMDWSTPAAGIHLREDLPLEAIAHAPAFANIRLMLRMLQESGGTKATKIGNLNSKFIRAYAEQMTPENQHHDRRMAMVKRFVEDDFHLLPAYRYIAESAGLARKYKGEFRITKKGTQLLADDKAGVLYELAFRHFFQRLSLAYLDRMPEIPALQDTIAFSFHAMHTHARDWILLDQLAIHLFLPGIYAEIPTSTVYEEESMAPLIARTRVLQPLHLFGLAEVTNKDYKHRHEAAARITPLFDQFLSFHLEETQDT